MILIKNLLFVISFLSVFQAVTNFCEILPQNRPPRSLDWYDHIASSQLASNTREPSPRQLRRLEQRRLEKQKKAEQADYEERKANLGPYDESRDAEFDKCMEERVPEDKPMNDYSAYRSCVDEHLRRIRLRKWKVYKEKQKARELWEKQHPTFLQWLWESFKNKTECLNPFGENPV